MVSTIPQPIDADRSHASDIDAMRAELRSWLDAHLTSDIVEAGRHPLDGDHLETLQIGRAHV